MSQESPVKSSRNRRPRFGSSRKFRRLSFAAVFLVAVVIWVINNPASYETVVTPVDSSASQTVDSENPENSATDQTNSATATDPNAANSNAADPNATLAIDILAQLAVKGRAPKTGYSRDEFYSNWPTVDGCNLRQKIIKREFGDTAVLDECDVIAGEFNDPYTGEHKVFTEKSQISQGVQIDHVVALSDAWQKGAQYLPQETRFAMATDPLNLLAVDAAANQQKSDGDAATWLPKNKAFRCTYVARQVSVKYKYGLWVTEAEKQAIANVLNTCPNEPAVGI